MWQDLVSEISALGWLAFVYGPEAWLVLPALLTFTGAMVAMVLLAINYFSNRKR